MLNFSKWCKKEGKGKYFIIIVILNIIILFFLGFLVNKVKLDFIEFLEEGNVYE